MKKMKAVLVAAISLFIIALLVVFILFSREWQPKNDESGKSQPSGPIGIPTPKPYAEIPSPSPANQQPVRSPSPPPPVGSASPDRSPALATAMRTYTVRVIDASDAPIPNANVLIEAGGTSLARGKSNLAGVFAFAGPLSSQYTRVHVSVHAPGFMALDEYSPLIEERIIHLSKTN